MRWLGNITFSYFFAVFDLSPLFLHNDQTYATQLDLEHTLTVTYQWLITEVKSDVYDCLVYEIH